MLCDYEICPPNDGRSQYRIFHKRCHISNVGKNGLTKADLTNVLETLPDGEPDILDELIYHDCCGYSDLEKFWLQRILTDDEDEIDYEIMQIAEQSPPQCGAWRWFQVCLFNTNKNKYYFRGICRIIREDSGMSEYMRKKQCPNAKNKNFYVDYSNMQANLQYWCRLKNIISLNRRIKN